MKIILAPDSFKGTFSATEVCRALETGIHSLYPDCEVENLPLADGGEGTLDVLMNLLGGEMVRKEVFDPLERPVEASFVLTEGDSPCAVIEMARTSGIILLETGELNPWLANTYGLGELIGSALDYEPAEIVITLGGSATVDGGSGMAEALGYRFLDSSGNEINVRGGRVLGEIARIDSSQVDRRLDNVKVSALCDVINPLTGNLGAARIFGPQKGADPSMVERLESGMQNLARRIREDLSRDVESIPGAGAAGGLGAAVVAFLGGELVSGIEYVLGRLNFEHRIAGADLIITGEGSYDSQSAGGKVVSGVLEQAKTCNIPVAVVCGLNKTGKKDSKEQNLWRIFSAADLEPNPGIVDRKGLETLGQLTLKQFYEDRKQG